MRDNKYNKIRDICIFILLLFVVSSVMFFLFYRQAVSAMSGSSLYPSDMKAYILEMQGLDSGYHFPYPIFFKLSAFFALFISAEAAVAFAVTVFNAASIIITKFALQKLVGQQLEKTWSKYPWESGIIISIVSISLYFVSMLYPPGDGFRYLGVFTPNPFHNATYMAARPFALLAFLWFAKLLPIYEKGCSIRKEQIAQKAAIQDYLLFSLFLLLATMTKPSFTIVLIGAAGLIMLYRLCKTRFQNFLPTIQLGLCFLPTFADLLYQYQGVFVPEEDMEGGIGFGLGLVWGEYCNNFFVAVCLAAGFPILVTLCNLREIKENTLFRFSWQIYGISFAMAFFLYEKGFRMRDFNFSWGYMYGIFFLFFGAIFVLLKATAKKTKSKWEKGAIGIQWLAYGWHLICGGYYFIEFLQGKMYY